MRAWLLLISILHANAYGAALDVASPNGTTLLSSIMPDIGTAEIFDASFAAPAFGNCLRAFAEGAVIVGHIADPAQSQPCQPRALQMAGYVEKGAVEAVEIFGNLLDQQDMAFQDRASAAFPTIIASVIRLNAA